MLIIGGDSTIGRSLLAFYKNVKEPIWCTTRHQAKVNGRCLFLDLAGDMVHWPLPPARVKTAFFFGGITSHEQCQLDPKLSRRVNVEGTVALATRLVKSGVFVIFLSSNAVFDGEIPFAKPDALVSPQTEYGRQKVDAENQLLKLSNKVAIVRLSKVISLDMPLIIDWIHDLKAGTTIHPYSDMMIAPIPIAFAVSVLHEVAIRQLSGIFQVSAKEDVTYSNMALYIAHKLGFAEELIRPVSYKDGQQTFLPRNTTLDSSRLSELGMFPPDVWAGLDYVFELEKNKSIKTDSSIQKETRKLSKH